MMFLIFDIEIMYIALNPDQRSNIIFSHCFYFSDAFAKLLSSGDLSEKTSSQFNTQDTDFAPILAKICFFAHFNGKELTNTGNFLNMMLMNHLFR